MPGHVQAVHVRQVQVDRDQDRVLFPGRCDSCNAVAEGIDIEAHFRQDQRQQPLNVLVILADQAKSP
jgi:hypothetical protein